MPSSVATVSGLQQPPNSSPKNHTHDWLSAPRFRRYLHAANGYASTALDLYMWNSTVAAAALADTCHLEVALRNAYDREMATTYPNWATDPHTQLFQRTQGNHHAVSKQQGFNQTSKKALRDAANGLGASPSHGQVIAETSFGFWTSLTVHVRKPLFWTPMLHKAFPPGTNPGHVNQLSDRIRKFRNRLAHNECVFSTNTGLHNRLNDVAALLRLLDPHLEAYVASKSMVPTLVAQCPVPGLI